MDTLTPAERNLARMGEQHLRLLLECRRHHDGRDILGDRAEALQHVAAHEEIDLPRQERQPVVHLRPARHDGHVEPVEALQVRVVNEAQRAVGHERTARVARRVEQATIGAVHDDRDAIGCHASFDGELAYRLVHGDEGIGHRCSPWVAMVG